MRAEIAQPVLNEYLREVSGNDFTAKDIRTWHAAVCAAAALRSIDAASPPLKRNGGKDLPTCIVEFFPLTE
jgi:DNA topoisomerase IB